ncbi:hypothetical protein BDM02DRAFT_3087350 [Thelephora ganbajun]|uniref:Uncharacterized protein n=1 Tax=Thelephora ganbajun TaxID=370292 RepID=A0ACB6ZUL0_THEGA|nr:hypothetical protein BDM02DRAFT_3087350 [Thelephora ganbajun]
MPRTKEPPETVTPSEVPLREKHELGVSQEDDRGIDTLVNRGPRQTGSGTVEEKKDDSTSDPDSSPTDSSDEFGWDKEEDNASTQIRNDHVVKAKRGRAAYLAFMKLARPLRVTLLCILGGGILITPLLIVHFLSRSNPVKKHVFAWSIWLTIIWVAGCLTYVVVDAFEWVFLGLVSLFGGKTESLQMQLELMIAVSAWVKFALDIVWAWVSLSVTRGIPEPPGAYWVYVNRAMQALFAAGTIILVEKVFLNFVSINFHRKALAERLAENKIGLEALDRLSNVHPASNKPVWKKKGHRHSSSGDLQKGHKSEHGSGSSSRSVTPENSGKKEKTRLGLRRKRKAVTSVIIDQVGEVIGQVALKDSRLHRRGEYGSLDSARKLAKKLFTPLSDVHPPRDYLIVEGQTSFANVGEIPIVDFMVLDFEPYFRTTADAHAAFVIFDKDGNANITKKEMREAVQRIYRERKALVASVKDTGSALAKLDAVLLSVTLIIIIFICLLIFNRVNTLSSLAPLATIILGFSFIFGHSAQVLFESLIFIFSTHVFDVGDLVMIGDNVMFVKEFGLFSTTFSRVDGQEIVAPNSLLANTKLVHNVRRSGSQWETTNLMISYDTPLSLVEQLRSRISQYISENSREWNNSAVWIDKMEFQNTIYLVVGLEHRRNWQDWGGRWERRNAFMKWFKGVLEELDITYTAPVQPILLPKGNPFLDVGSPGTRPSPFRGFSSDPASGMFHGANLARSPTQTMR